MGKQNKKKVSRFAVNILDVLNILRLHDKAAIDVNSIAFSLSTADVSGEGVLHWNPDDGTLEIGMPGGDVNLQIGQEQILLAKNMSGDDLANGTAIIITGASGARPEVEKAATTPQATSGAIGMTTEAIDANQQGFITTFGLVRDVNTGDFPAGSRVFLSDTPGELSLSLPAAANRKVFMGISLRQHAEEGVIWCSPLSLLYLSELSAVVITNPQDGDVPTYHAASGTWINQAP